MNLKQLNLSGKDTFDIGRGVFDGFGGMMFASEEEYENRKVARYDKEGIYIDTCYASDTGFFETGIRDLRYRADGEFIIVCEYQTSEEAKAEHENWVLALTEGIPPKRIKDIFSNEVFELKQN